MRFSGALDSLEKQVKILRVVIVSLCSLAIALCIGIFRVSQKNPLIIERGCISRVLPVTEGESSKEEAQGFLELAIAERFNSKFTGTEFLSPDQALARDQEQKELGKLNMKQVVIVNSVEINDSKFTVNADRLISAGDVRSAFKWTLIGELKSEGRSESNPYGLVLMSIKPKEEKPPKEVQSK